MPHYSLKQILTFIEVARERSVSKAAERLFVTQPAVSMQIKQLEETFGLALLEPVSYTHLRAHATVLDLVCRLLLEKKKKTVCMSRRQVPT